MIITLDPDSSTPFYEQLRNQIVLGIATGQLEPGEKLPTVRQLAEELSMNPMTVNKAYALMKQEGFIAIDRRHGAKVKPQLASSQERKELPPRLEQELQLLIAEASIHGMDEDGFQEACGRIFAQMTGGFEKGVLR
ncbi:DNA-binding transcriptional regulator YhcF, GntR family [Paenibacillaceae bacterium GAS479]|nr:DNA-binding transcriptional regulator YhcF, GntR family [Paenibacillaceae bacterium GAS479]